MIYLGMFLIVAAIAGIVVQRKTSDIIILEEHQNGKTRIVRKFVVFKFLQDNKGVMRFGFLQTKNVVQILSFTGEDVWVDVSWATAQS